MKILPVFLPAVFGCCGWRDGTGTAGLGTRMALKYGVIYVAASFTHCLSGHKHLDDFNELCSNWLCYHSVFADQLMHKFVEGGKEAGAGESRI